MKILETIAFAWFFSCVVESLGLMAWVFRRLRTSHPDTYQALGEPRLFLNRRDCRWPLTVFLYGGQWRSLHDDRLSLVCRVLIGLAVANALVLMTLAFLIWLNR